MKHTYKLTILSGTNHHHVLHGSIIHEEGDFQKFIFENEIFLKHQQSDGLFSNEHHTVILPKGIAYQGKQIEFNPFTLEINDLFD